MEGTLNESDSFLRRYSLVIGIVLMFLLTWPIDLANEGLVPFQVPFMLYLFLGWGFGVAALLMTWLTLGRPAASALFMRYFKWRVGWKWYVALFIVPAAVVLGAYIDGWLRGAAPDFSNVLADQVKPESLSRLAFVIPFFLVDLIANGEEIGWRGYVLPRLQSRYTALAAALITGVIWAFWHTPKFLNHWSTPYYLIFFVDTIAKSVLLAWLYNNTGGSLLLTAMAHAAWNTAGIFVPAASTLSNENLGAFAAGVALIVVLVIVIVIRSGAQDLSRTRPRQKQD
jgi:membrane protease YdiL (CAAX protease family)